MSEENKLRKEDLDAAFGAWYDHKMEPECSELLQTHHSTIDVVKVFMETNLGYRLTRVDVKRAISERFGAWMKEQGLPKPPKK